MNKKEIDELAVRAISGDAEAFSALYMEYRMPLTKYIIRQGASESDAEDVVAEAFTQAYAHIRELREPAYFGTWLHRIARNIYVRNAEKEGRIKPVIYDEYYDGSERANDAVDLAAQQETVGAIADENLMLPEDFAENAEVKRMLAQTILSMKEEFRSAVFLYYYENLSVPQIARREGVSEGTVKSRLHYARKKLREKLEPLAKSGGLFAFVPFGVLFGSVDLSLELTAAAGAGAGARTGTGTGASASAGAGAGASASAGAAASAPAAAAVSTVGTKVTAGIVSAVLAGTVAAGVYFMSKSVRKEETPMVGDSNKSWVYAPYDSRAEEADIKPDDQVPTFNEVTICNGKVTLSAVADQEKGIITLTIANRLDQDVTLFKNPTVIDAEGFSHQLNIYDNMTTTSSSRTAPGSKCVVNLVVDPELIVPGMKLTGEVFSMGVYGDRNYIIELS